MIDHATRSTHPLTFVTSKDGALICGGDCDEGHGRCSQCVEKGAA
jgi:hypothetical protein